MSPVRLRFRIKVHRETTFQEAHTVVDGERVAEAAIKITEIAPGIAVAIAGHVMSAINIVDFIRDHHSNYATPDALFDAISVSAQPQKHVQILLAWAPSTGSATLTKWDSTTGIEQPKSDFREIGRLPLELRTITRGSLDIFAHKYKMDELTLLPMMTAVLQSHGINDTLLEKVGVGGIMFGLRVNAGTTAWQADTAYLLYDMNFENIVLIFAMIRNDVLVVHSSRFVGPKLLSFPSKKYTPKLLQLPQLIDPNQWHHFSGLRKGDRRVTSIYRPSLDVPSRYVRFSPSDIPGDTRLLVQPTQRFRADLCQPISMEIPSDPRCACVGGFRFIVDQPNLNAERGSVQD